MRPIYMVCLVLILFGVASGVGMTQEEWMPDPDLREAVGRELQIPDGVPLLPTDMKNLYRLESINEDVGLLKA